MQLDWSWSVCSTGTDSLNLMLLSTLGFQVRCDSTGQSYSYSLTKGNFYFVDSTGSLNALPVNININANNLFKLDVAVYFFLSLLGITIMVSVFLATTFCCLKDKRVPFYAWENEPFEEAMSMRMDSRRT